MRKVTRGDLLKFLTEEAKRYRKDALASLERNKHMSSLSQSDFAQLKRNKERTQKLVDALLVDFINAIGAGQCIDYGLYVKYLKV